MLLEINVNVLKILKTDSVFVGNVIFEISCTFVLSRKKLNLKYLFQKSVNNFRPNRALCRSRKAVRLILK